MPPPAFPPTTLTPGSPCGARAPTADLAARPGGSWLGSEGFFPGSVLHAVIHAQPGPLSEGLREQPRPGPRSRGDGRGRCLGCTVRRPTLRARCLAVPATSGPSRSSCWLWSRPRGHRGHSAGCGRHVCGVLPRGRRDRAPASRTGHTPGSADECLWRRSCGRARSPELLPEGGVQGTHRRGWCFWCRCREIARVAGCQRSAWTLEVAARREQCLLGSQG